MSLDSHPENGGADNVLGFDHVPEGLDGARQEVLAPDLRLGNTILVAEKWVEVRIIHQPELPGDNAQVRGADEDGPLRADFLGRKRLADRSSAIERRARILAEHDRRRRPVGHVGDLEGVDIAKRERDHHAERHKPRATPEPCRNRAKVVLTCRERSICRTGLSLYRLQRPANPTKRIFHSKPPALTALRNGNVPFPMN